MRQSDEPVEIQCFNVTNATFVAPTDHTQDDFTSFATYFTDSRLDGFL
jgi:hypothetical protein